MRYSHRPRAADYWQVRRLLAMRSACARAVPDGRDIEAKLAQATIAVIQCCSQQIGQRFAVGVAGESGGVHIQFVDDAMHVRQCGKNIFVDLTPVFGIGCCGCRSCGCVGRVSSDARAARVATDMPLRHKRRR